MARSVIQVPVDKPMEDRFEAFMKKEGIEKQSEAGRQLFDFALRILERDDDSLSNRELLESIYRRVRHVQGVSNLTHNQTFSIQAMKDNNADSREMREKVIADVDKKVDEYFSNK